MSKCKCEQLPYHDKFTSSCSCKCHFVEPKETLEGWVDEFRKKYNPIIDPDARNGCVEQFLRNLLSKQRSSIKKELVELFEKSSVKKWGKDGWAKVIKIIKSEE